LVGVRLPAAGTLDFQLGHAYQASYDPTGRVVLVWENRGEVNDLGQTSDTDETWSTWDAGSGARLSSVRLTESPGARPHGHMTFSPDGRRLVSVERGGTDLVVRDARTLRPVATVSVGALADQQNTAPLSTRMVVGLTGYGQLVVYLDGVVHRWTADSGTPVGPPAVLLPDLPDVANIRINPARPDVVTVRPDGEIRIWRLDRMVNVGRGRVRDPAPGSAGYSGGYEIDPTGHRLALVAKDRSVVIWDLDVGQEILRLRSGTGLVRWWDGQRIRQNTSDPTETVIAPAYPLSPWDRLLGRARPVVLPANSDVRADLREMIVGTDAGMARVGTDLADWARQLCALLGPPTETERRALANTLAAAATVCHA
jgi:WD40 repeat protein